MEKSVLEIKNFENFLEKHFKNDTKVLSYVTRYLTALGDNYGSTMLGVSTKLQEGSNPPYNLELVAKTPPLNPILRTLFQIEKTFIKENAIYTEMLPVIIDLQRELKVPDGDYYDVLAECYGARISLDVDATAADDNALLILENLREQGYKNGNRLESFNMEESKVMLRHLAKFHASPITVRHHKPHLFDTKFKPFLDYIREIIEDELQTPMRNLIYKSIMHLKEFDDYIDIIKEEHEKHDERMSAGYVRQENIDFCTAVHNDFWVNNMMMKYVDGQPKHVKIIDFQVTFYGSLAYDIIFFLFTSVKVDILENQFDELLKYYYDQFTSILGNAKVPLQNYSYEKFIEEINAVARLHFCYILYLMKGVFTKTDNMPEKHEEFENDFLSRDDSVGEEFYNQLTCCLRQYVKRGWLSK